MWANNLSNAGPWFEGSVLREVTQTCINTLSSFSPLSVVLIAPQPCKKQLKDTVLEVWGSMDVVSSTGANVNGLTVYSGDVVLLELDGAECVAEVVIHLQLPNNAVYSIITPWHGLGNNIFKASLMMRPVQICRNQEACFSMVKHTALYLCDFETIISSLFVLFSFWFHEIDSKIKLQGIFGEHFATGWMKTIITLWCLRPAPIYIAPR